MLGLRFCARAFSSCGKWGPLFITVRGPLTVVASPVAEHRLQMCRLQTCRLSSCGSRAQPLRGMWDLPGPGHEPVSPASAGRFPTTAPPGKPPFNTLIHSNTAFAFATVYQKNLGLRPLIFPDSSSFLNCFLPLASVKRSLVLLIPLLISCCYGYLLNIGV